MGWSQELQDFSEGFGSGYKMVRSREEREADKLANRLNTAKAAQAEWETSPEGFERQKLGFETDVAAKQTETALTGERLTRAKYENTDEYRAWEKAMQEADVSFKTESAKKLAWENSDENRALQKQLDEANLADTQSTIDWRKEDTRLKKTEADKRQKQLDMFDEYQKKRGGRGTLKDEDTPGPQSAVEVPVESTTTYSPSAGEPVSLYPGRDAAGVAALPPSAVAAEPAVPLEQPVRTAGIQVEPRAGQPEAPAPAPTEAVPVAPTTPATPATPAYGVPTTEAGPRAHPHVDRIQRPRAEIENTPAQPRLDEATVNILEFAGSQTDTRAVITSGGTGGEPAQVRLYDMKTNRPLDPNVLEDRERIEAFNAAAQSAPSQTTSPLERTGSVYKVAREATMVGLDRAADKLGVKNQSAVDTPEYEQAAMGFLSGDYGADAEQVEQAKNVVQEMAAEAGHELNEAEEAIYTVAYAYDSYMAAGMYEEAKEAAAAVVGHYTRLAGQFAAVAKAAVMDGDLPAGMEAAARAYANVPDGVGVDFNQTRDGKYEVVMTNEETGEVTTRSILTPQEIGGLIMKIDPSHFLSTMSQAAGKDLEATLSPEAAEQMGKPEWAGMLMTEVATMQAEAKENRLRGGGGGAVDVSGEEIVSKPAKGPTAEQEEQTVEGVKEAFANIAANHAMFNENDAKYTTDLDPSTNSNLMMNIRPIAEQIALDNRGVRPALVAEAIVNMVDNRPTSVKAGDDENSFIVQVEGGPPLTFNKDLYHRLSVTRANLSPEEEARQETLQQNLRDIRQAPEFAPGFVPDYDPTRYPVGERVGGAPVVGEAVPTQIPSRVPVAPTVPIIPEGLMRQTPPRGGWPVKGKPERRTGIGVR